jgi:hypothetical protein
MKGKRRWLLCPLIIMVLLLCAVPAYAIPPVPHAFYGTLTIGGSPAAVGTVVTAKVGGVEYGSITTTVEGQYGSSDPLGDRLLVAPGEGEIETGDTIYFYANGSEANQTYAFSPDAVTELNLTVGDTEAPTVSSTSPVADKTDVAVTTTVTATFSEAMNATTITTSSFTLDSVAGTVSYDSGTYTATFTPSADLSYDTTYTATLSTAITDAAGNPLASAYSWNFTTVSSADTTAPSVTITPLTPDPTDDNTPTFTGTATDTESNISSVEYKVDTGSWTAATASDGAFDSLSEGYTFTTDALLEGAHTVYVRATDAYANTTAEGDYASDSFTVTVIPGDATGDGVVDALDITKVERIIALLDAETPGADANQDGVVNALDITKVEIIIATP